MVPFRRRDDVRGLEHFGLSAGEPEITLFSILSVLANGDLALRLCT
jgi:hypothetical protein